MKDRQEAVWIMNREMEQQPHGSVQITQDLTGHGDIVWLIS